ncbi:hypothetical protein AK812_SmicGene9828 [Symbiodinium microadriaticum]|uniref:Uncharacterized protein n=1 Tax=Symbiodinium microadriaticum TaxID=2951 RepID=A0A1Q9EHK4_SYMMI|nr:hypothetical protein AK812_SmicGene9828 [Symbiodinium microadriaticum]
MGLDGAKERERERGIWECFCPGNFVQIVVDLSRLYTMDMLSLSKQGQLYQHGKVLRKQLSQTVVCACAEPSTITAEHAGKRKIMLGDIWYDAMNQAIEKDVPVLQWFVTDRQEPTALHGDTWHGAAQSMRCLGGRCWVERAMFLKRRKSSWTYSWYTLTLPLFLDEMQEADALLCQLGIASE